MHTSQVPNFTNFVLQTI